MKITELTGVTKSTELTVTKAIGSIIVVGSLELEDLTNEKISLYIERGNGSNVILANKVLLKDFILASSYGVEAVQSDADNKIIAICELALDGGIFLEEKESIKITLEDLKPLKTYSIYGVEEPVLTDNLYFFEQKSVASEEVNKKIDVRGFDLAVVNLHESISDLSYGYENGQVVKYLPFEVQVLSRDVDPIQVIKQDGSVLQNVSGMLSLPLVAVDTIEINKSQGTIINFLVRSLKKV